MMRPTPQKSRNVKGKGPSWMLVAGGALLSSLSIHIGYKLKQALEAKQRDKGSSKGDVNSNARRQPEFCHIQSNVYTYELDKGFCNCDSGGAGGKDEIKNPPNFQTTSEPEISLSLVAVSAPGYHQENGNVWISSPERTDIPPKRFHHSNSSDSPCASDCSSDVFSKREVIQKLRQQLKRRDDMILEMQDQVTEFQNALSGQASHSNHLQSQLDSANRELLDSEREIQRLRKAIADHCLGHVECKKQNSSARVWPSEGSNGYPKISEKSKGDLDKIEMLKGEIGELRDVIEGKEYLLQSYKEQKSELSVTIRELQHRLDSQLPNIL